MESVTFIGTWWFRLYSVELYLFSIVSGSLIEVVEYVNEDVQKEGCFLYTMGVAMAKGTANTKSLQIPCMNIYK